MLARRKLAGTHRTEILALQKKRCFAHCVGALVQLQEDASDFLRHLHATTLQPHSPSSHSHTTSSAGSCFTLQASGSSHDDDKSRSQWTEDEGRGLHAMPPIDQHEMFPWWTHLVQVFFQGG